MIYVYRIDFVDGSSYVGQTTDIKRRIRQHVKRPSNATLYAKLSQGMQYTLTILSRHRKQECANKAENKAIGKLARPINRILANGQFRPKEPGEASLPPEHYTCRPFSRKKKVYPGRKYPPRMHGTLRCNWCREKKPATEFFADRCRSSGRNSRCKTCLNTLYRLKTEGIRSGRSTSESYYMAKEACKPKTNAQEV